MNGRVYDYNLGRFLSVDPFIQAPGNSQSMNPYSYIMNNPLAGTDPSGYRSICKTEMSCTTILVNQGDGKTKSGTVALDNGKKVNVTVRTNKPTDATEIGDIKLKDVESMTVGNKDDYTVYVVHQTGGTNGYRGNSGSQLNFMGMQLRGELKDESLLGVAPMNAIEVFNEGREAAKNIPLIRKGVGKPEFKDEFGIGYQDKNGNNQIKSFPNFDDANTFAKKINGGWVDAIKARLTLAQTHLIMEKD
jgi:hypothetical protein